MRTARHDAQPKQIFSPTPIKKDDETEEEKNKEVLPRGS